MAGRPTNPAHVRRLFRHSPVNDVKPHGVTKSVHITAMWGPNRALDETRWLQSVADKHGFPHGIVCNADVSDPGVDAALKGQRQFPNLRGVHQMLYWDSETVRQAAPVRISAIRPISAVGSRCWKNTICISSCRFMQGRWPTPLNLSRRSAMSAW